MKEPMETNEAPLVPFDILLRSAGAGKLPTAQNIDQFKPPAGDIEKCRRWLIAKGVTCHPTEFGLACEATPALFGLLFSTEVEYDESTGDLIRWRCSRPPRPPQELESYIQQITITAPPEFF